MPNTFTDAEIDNLTDFFCALSETLEDYEREQAAQEYEYRLQGGDEDRNSGR